jgi:hypothetical protein
VGGGAGMEIFWVRGLDIRVGFVAHVRKGHGGEPR